MPKVSIIVPVYNTSAYLRRCMDALTEADSGGYRDHSSE